LLQRAGAEDNPGGRGKFKLRDHRLTLPPICLPLCRIGLFFSTKYGTKLDTKCERRSPSLVLWKNICELRAGARSSHHGSHRIAPGLVMPGCLVCRRRGFSSIHFHKYKPRRVVWLLKNIEPCNPGFLHAFSSIGEGGLLESFHRFRLYVDVNVDDE